jgi:hypothetical protein
VGGTAFLIYGTLSPERLAPAPVPRTLLDRLLRRTRYSTPRVTPMGRRELTTVEARELEPLITRYRAYLARKLPHPHEASRQVLEYLELDRIPSLYLRGEREAGSEPRWYVQLGFSGCSGMAEVSAAVGYHWAAAWVRDELPEIQREILAPFGFQADLAQVFEDPDRFLPVAALGYLRYLLPEDREEDGGSFEVDYAVLDDAVENAATILADANRRHAALLGDGRCRCQLCEPDFVPLAG